jgi:hypothetical protein
MLNQAKGNNFSEEHILGVASKLCAISPGNILLIGGALALPEVAGYKRLRNRSDDIDCVVSDAGLEQITEMLNLRRECELKPTQGEGCYFTYIRGMMVAFFQGDLRGYVLTPDIFDKSLRRSTTRGDVHIVRPELNIALKIRRGISKGKIYGKDGKDFATIVLGMEKKGEHFSAVMLKNYLSRGVCHECNLGASLSCLRTFEKYSEAVPKSERPTFARIAGECTQSLGDQCRYS